MDQKYSSMQASGRKLINSSLTTLLQVNSLKKNKKQKNPLMYASEQNLMRPEKKRKKNIQLVNKEELMLG